MRGVVAIRPAEIRDLAAASRICHLNGGTGRGANLIAHVYVGPYLEFVGQLAFIAEADGSMLGYAVGTVDTRAFEARLERDWWPGLRARYREPAGKRSGWTPDERRIWSFHHPARVPEDIAGTFPAHIHMHLLPKAQGRGIGTRLLAAWMEEARRRKVSGVHAGVGARNKAGLAFWKARGFEPVRTDMKHGSNGTVWCGRKI